MRRNIIVVGGGRWRINHIKTLIDLNSFHGVVEPNKENQHKLRRQFPNIIILSPFIELTSLAA